MRPMSVFLSWGPHLNCRRCQDCKNDLSSGINIELIDNSPFHLRGTFGGPQDTPYEGGHFEVVRLAYLPPHKRAHPHVKLTQPPQDIAIPDAWPFEPTKMKFITKVYHPNVSSASGAISISILKDSWSPMLTLRTTLISLQSLLSSPYPDEPEDAEVAKHYMTSRTSFEDTARHWTHMYAGGPGPRNAGKAGASVVAAASLFFGFVLYSINVYLRSQNPA